jgi:hypothetical protein
MKCCFLKILLFTGILTQLEAQEQYNMTGPEILQAQMAGLNRISDSLFSMHNDLFNGIIYTSDALPADNHFFLDNLWIEDTVFYSGAFCGKEIIKYDLLTDNVVILLEAKGASYPISVNRSVIRKFIINGHHFVFLDDFQTQNKAGLIPGYYEVLYNGNTGFYVRWTKRKDINKQTLQTEYQLEVRCYLRKEGIYYLIRNNRDLLSVLKDHMEDIKSFIRDNRLRFTHSKRGNAIKVLEYYDNL